MSEDVVLALPLVNQAIDQREEVCANSAEYELVQRVVHGTKEDFRLLVERHEQRIYRLIMRQVGDRVVAEDLTQEVFLKAYSNLARFRGAASFNTWITRIALNQTSSYFASRRYRQNKRTDQIGLRHLNVETTRLDYNKEERLLLRFRTALAELKPALREVLTLYALEGRTYEEAAQVLGIPVGTVRSRLNKARSVMKRKLVKGMGM